ncbi:hypothetical protein GPJ61_27635 [Brevibacillus formosus]|uniref:hypothetical protein n=1 Tax=Brevibacillus formosus TaxID=54913 RepID=UPI001CA51DC0|nr:hypothetical protein [Brevibacillus formosus]MBW5471563.1 hypothetical protein [Brevibacillus formosus]
MNKKLVALTIFITHLLMANSTYAAISGSIMVTGTKKMLQDGLTALLILVPIAAALRIAWLNYQKKGLEEPAEIAAKDKHVKKIMIAAISAFCASAAIKVVLSYYGVTANV